MLSALPTTGPAAAPQTMVSIYYFPAPESFVLSFLSDPQVGIPVG